MKKFSWNTPVWIQPMFGITPKTFNAINVRTPLGFSGFLAYYNVISSNCQRSVGMPVVGIIQTARFGMGSYQTDQFLSPTTLYREDAHLSVSLQNTEHDDFTGCTPATFARSVASKQGFIAFYRSSKSFPAFFVKRQRCPYQTKKSLYRRNGNLQPKSHPINWHTQNKQFQQPLFGCVLKSAGILDCNPTVSSSTPATFKSPITKMPCPRKFTFGTVPHDQTIVHDLVRFG